MMKQLMLLFIALCIGQFSYAQKGLLSLNEHNQYTYFQVKPVSKPVSAELLAAYLKKNESGVQSATVVDNGGMAAKGGMLVYKQGLVTGQEDGQIAYKLTVDFKDNKYRLMITDFMFTPYQRNRFGVFAPTGITTPLEKAQGKIRDKQLNNYLDKLGAYCAKVDKLIQNYINNPEPAKSNPAGLKKIDTQNW
ncbi:DUF4468 domain-containing protein [Mucilaginibacter sp. PAMB04274]|uniref:DUF4468 domain-containing protein n=1 Tax=Mucilaginibacter sp. PAMB04274 TaxID=3138568 RepID=UPI0031F615C8